MLDGLLDDRNPSVSGIVAGISKGKVWLFEESNPVLAVVYSYCVGGFGLAGTIKSEQTGKMKRFLHDIFDELKADGIDQFEFSAEEEALYEQMFSLFPDKTFHSEMEHSYRLKHSYEKLSNRLGDFFIRKVDETLIKGLNDGEYKNADRFLERMKNSWGDSEQFLTYSVAFLVLKEEEIVGIIFGSSRYKDILAVDIEVDKQYRKQGLATMLTYHMLNECSKQDITLQWDHVESNTASKYLAEKVGFQLLKSRPYYWFEI